MRERESEGERESERVCVCDGRKSVCPGREVKREKCIYEMR